MRKIIKFALQMPVAILLIGCSGEVEARSGADVKNNTAPVEEAGRPPAKKNLSGVTASRIMARESGEHAGDKDLSARADFAGDGLIDEAYFVRTDSGINLVVKRQGKPAENLFEAKSVKNIGVRVKPAGQYAKACAKGFGAPCVAGEPDVMTLRGPAIELFKYESSARVYVYDGEGFTVHFLAD